MIVSEVDREDEEYEIQYPIIMRSILTGTIILFYERNSGVVLHQGTSVERAGSWSDVWVNADNTSYWQPLKGEVTLRN